MGNLTLARVRLRAGERILLEDLDLAVAAGELLAIVGPNGVGKTTLLRAMSGFAPPDAGAITLGEAEVYALRAHDRARALTLIGSDAETPAGTTVREAVATGRFPYRPWWDWSESDDDARAVDVALERVGLLDAADRLFDTLSSGERQRAWLALALAQDANLVLLDEPTSHLDPRYALEMLGLVRSLAREPKSVVVVLHDLNEAAAFADRIAILGERRLLTCAAPKEALDPRILERAFGVAFERIAYDGSVRVFPLSASSAH